MKDCCEPFASRNAGSERLLRGSFTDPAEGSRITPNALYPVIWPETGRFVGSGRNLWNMGRGYEAGTVCPSIFAAQLHLDIPRREAPLCLHKICKEGLDLEFTPRSMLFIRKSECMHSPKKSAEGRIGRCKKNG